MDTAGTSQRLFVGYVNEPRINSQSVNDTQSVSAALKSADDVSPILQEDEPN